MKVFNISIRKRAIFSFLLIFLVGFLSHGALSILNNIHNSPNLGKIVKLDPNNDKPAKISVFELDNNKNRPISADRIREDQIHVYKGRIVLDIEDASWARFTDTNSMLPIIDKGSNSIELAPKSIEDIHVGDIISYRSKYADGIIIHRVIEKGLDDEGVYFILKGDSLDKPDPGRIRFDQIVGVVVGIIY